MTVDNEATEETAQEPAPGRRTGRVRRWMGRCLAKWRPILLTSLLVATTGFGAGYFYFVYRPDLQTNDAAARQAITAASDGAVLLLSYTPDTLNRDFTNARSRVTENYLAYYQRFADQIVGPASQAGQVATKASVVKAAVSELHPNSAVVLVFLKQKTTSKDKPDPVVTSSSVLVTLTKVNGSWLIDRMGAP